MTVSTTIGYQRTGGDGATTSFAVPFALIEAAQLVVELVNKTTGVVTPQVLGTHYTLAIAADFQSATVTMLTAPAATHWVVRRRSALFTQPTHLLPHGPFPADSVETALDRLAMDLQAVRDSGGRGIRVADSDPTLAALPPIDTIKSSYIFIDASGNPIGVAGGASVAISTPMVPVVQGASLGAALTAFGFSSYFQTLIDETTAAGLVNAAGLYALQQALGADVGRRQTVLGGPVTSAGLPDFLPASASGLTLTFQNISASFPFVVAAAQGFGAAGPLNRIGVTTANPQVVLANNATSYLYADVSATGGLTFGSTTTAPVYQEGGTYSTTSGAHTFNIMEMVMKLGDGSAAAAVWRVFLGEAVTSGGNISSTVAYAYRGRYDSGWTATLPGGATAVSRNHNIGGAPRVASFLMECTTTDNGYAVGDQLNVFSTHGFDSATYRPSALNAGAKAMSLIAPGANAFLALHKSTANPAQLTAASWKYKFVADRGW